MAQLNAAQHAAVEHERGPLLVLAGAGSGKTRVITHRIARLLEKGYAPDSILAVSFTNKAAEEMRERMASLVGREVAETLWLSTFHSFGVRFLSEEAADLDHGGRFVIFDQGDALGLVRELLRRQRAQRRLDAMAILTRISLWKNAFIPPDKVPESDFEYDAIARDIYPEYEASLRSMHAVDFDDLVVVPARLLAERDDLRGKWRNRFRHLLIDEFQDTNRSQLELVRLLTNELHNVCVVGDDDQSIYGWRGADVGNILDFESHFPGAHVVKLEENYRSRAQILDVANSAIGQSSQRRHGKALRAIRGLGDKVRLVTLKDAEAEAKFVAREIDQLVRKEGCRFGDIAILYRSNLQARVIEEELRIFEIPYRMFGGTQFFDRKEVKDAAAYLRVLINPRDELSLRRIVNYPPRGIGSTTIQHVGKHAAGRGISFARALEQPDKVEGLTDAARRNINAFNALIERGRAELKGGSSVASVAREIFEQAGLHEVLIDEGGNKTGARRWENVVYLIQSIERYEQDQSGGKPSLATFLQRITMRFDQDQEAQGDRVALSTLHASKGLEFPIVFLIGCIEGQLPHSRTTDPKVTEAAPTDVEEERRLFYVGVTRAQDKLYLSRPRQRSMRGKTIPLTPSRFLDGLAEAALEEYSRKEEVAMDTTEVADMARALLDQLGGNPSSSSNGS